MSARWETGMLSAAGGRPYNEDHCNSPALPRAGCWVLCDGLGGHGGGANASRIAVDTILQCFRTSPEVSAKALEAYLPYTATYRAATARERLPLTIEKCPDVGKLSGIGLGARATLTLFLLLRRVLSLLLP